jgi:hypothetical protein
MPVTKAASEPAAPAPSSMAHPVSPPLTNSAPAQQPPSSQAQPVVQPKANGTAATEQGILGNRPTLQAGETYISTDYKGRLMGDHIAKQLEVHRAEGKKGPLMVGLQGPQGCGASTLPMVKR